MLFSSLSHLDQSAGIWYKKCANSMTGMTSAPSGGKEERGENPHTETVL
jgi:hypothetical protein